MTADDPTLTALRRAILSEPVEDLHRLAFADRLDELAGRETWRAELIRIQCLHLPPLPDCGHASRDAKACRRCDLLEREQTCLIAAGAAGLRRLPWGQAPRQAFTRGFLGRVTCTAADWLRHADSLYWRPDQCRPCPPTAHPIERVTLTTLPDLDTNVHVAFSVDEVAFRLRGRPRGPRVRIYGPDATAHAAAAELLRLAWPRVAFGLPPPLPAQFTGHLLHALAPLPPGQIAAPPG